MINLRHEILGVNIDVLNMRQTVQKVELEYLLPKRPLHLMGVNADKINQCFDDKEMKKIVNNCGIINADGASVILAGKYLGKVFPERVAGIDLMQELLKLAENKGYSTYFLGAKESVINDMINILQNKYSRLNVIGFRNGYFDDEEWKIIADELKSLSPQLVFVGITSPKKEYLIEYLIEKGVNSVFMGVGGSFDVLSGNISRAPIWVQKINMEWFYRMIMEPKRLFKRYLIGNIKFIKRIFHERRSIG